MRALLLHRAVQHHIMAYMVTARLSREALSLSEQVPGNCIKQIEQVEVGGDGLLLIPI